MCVCSNCFSHFLTTLPRTVAQLATMGDSAKTSVGAGISCSLFHVCSLQVWPRFNGISPHFLSRFIFACFNCFNAKTWPVSNIGKLHQAAFTALSMSSISKGRNPLGGTAVIVSGGGGGITLGRSEQERSTERKSWVHSTTTRRLGSRYPRSSSNTVADSTRCNKMIC